MHHMLLTLHQPSLSKFYFEINDGNNIVARYTNGGQFLKYKGWGESEFGKWGFTQKRIFSFVIELTDLNSNSVIGTFRYNPFMQNGKLKLKDNSIYTLKRTSWFYGNYVWKDEKGLQLVSMRFNGIFKLNGQIETKSENLDKKLMYLLILFGIFQEHIFNSYRDRYNNWLSL